MKHEYAKKMMNRCASAAFMLSLGMPLAFASEGNHTDGTAANPWNTSLAALPQSGRNVSGKVVDSSGQPVVGANVVVKGTTTGTITDANGNFSLEVPRGATLQITYIGFKGQDITVGNRHTLNITMSEDSEALNEVVVVGYGTMRKSDVTGSIATAKGTEITKQQDFNALDALKGKVSGVNIFSNTSQPGAYNTRVIIRGVSSINSSTNPLYVVDGVEMENFDLLNPNDIESVEVLKDASSAAIYGARGANGVILVTTKRGEHGGSGTRVSYQGSVSLSTLARKMDMMNANEWVTAFMTGLQNENRWLGTNWSLNKSDWFNDPNYFDASGNPLYNTNWQDEATRNAISNNHQLNIQQQGPHSSVGAFLNYTDQEGIMNNTYNKRVNARLTYDADPYKWLSTSVNLSINHTWQRYTPEDGGGQEARRTMIEMLPWLPVRDKNGNYTTSTSSTVNNVLGFEGMSNPVMILDLQRRMNYRTQIFGNAALTFHIIPGLDLKTQFGVDAHLNQYKGYSSVLLNNISMPNGWAEKDYTNTLYWQEETYLTYKKVFGDHRINAMAGLSWSERTYDYTYSHAEGFSDDFLQWNNMESGTTPSAPSSEWNRWAMNSYFLRAAYTYKDRYSLTLTGRVDGSSKFGANNKYAFFPSAGVAWNIANESFMKDYSKINELKLHTSYGLTGNSEIDPYKSLATIGSGTYLIDGTRAPYAYVNTLANPDLKWEKTAQWDLGVNLSMFNNRLGVDASYYYKRTTDLLLNCPVPHSSGYSTIFKNIGSVKNQGMDLLLRGTPIETKDFSWDMSLNFNYNRNRVLKLGNNNADIFNLNWVSNNMSIIRVGEDISSFWGYKRYGIWTEEDYKAGKCAENQIGRPHRSDSPEIIGHGLPDWTGSFMHNFRYKNFDLSLDFQFVWGVDVMQRYFHPTRDRFGITNGLTDILYDGYQVDANGNSINPNTTEQAIFLNNGGTAPNGIKHGLQDTMVDSSWICDGSYLRLNDAQFGYTFTSDICKKMGIHSLRVYIAGDNLFLLCSPKFKGFDPEGTSETSAFGQGMIFYAYPKARTYTFGLNVTF